MKRWMLLIAFVIFLLGCSGTLKEKEPGVSGEEKEYMLTAEDEKLPSLKEHFSSDFLFGAAINTWMLEEGCPERDVILKHYNILTCENEMKPEYVNPSDGVFDFEATDAFVAFCEEQDIAAHGHCLVWHSQVPKWWFQGDGKSPVTSGVLLDRLSAYISAVVGRYAGQIAVWDVVNEAFNDDGSLRKEDGDSYYVSTIGDLNGDGKEYDYIEYAFTKAHEADSDAMLIYNDYGLESNGKKAQAAYEMLKDMLERGVPVHGVGLQMHLQHDWPSVREMKKNLELFLSLKEIDPEFTVQVTELDMSIFSWADKNTSKTLRERDQLKLAKRWGEIFAMLEELDIYAVTTWGISDDASWLNDFPIKGRTDAPLLFDENYMAKPAFWSILDPECAKEAVKAYE